MTTAITKKNYPVRYPDFGWVEVDFDNYVYRNSRTLGRTKIAEGVISHCPTTSIRCGWYIDDRLGYALCSSSAKLALVQFTRYCKSPLQNGIALLIEDQTVELTPLCIFPAEDIRNKYFSILADNLIREYKAQLKPEIQAFMEGKSANRGVFHQQWYTVSEENYAITRVLKAAFALQMGNMMLLHSSDNHRKVLTYNYEATRGSQQESKYVLARVLSQVLDESSLHKPMLLDVLCNRYTHASMACDVQPQRAWRDML